MKKNDGRVLLRLALLQRNFWSASPIPVALGPRLHDNFFWTHAEESNHIGLEWIQYMGNPLSSSVPGGRDALDLLCITFSAYQVLHDSSLVSNFESTIADLFGRSRCYPHDLQLLFC